jgi:hypothetical protein
MIEGFSRIMGSCQGCRELLRLCLAGGVALRPERLEPTLNAFGIKKRKRIPVLGGTVSLAQRPWNGLSTVGTKSHYSIVAKQTHKLFSGT